MSIYTWDSRGLMSSSPRNRRTYQASISVALPEYDVHRARAHRELRALVADRRQVEILEEVLALPEHDGPDSEMHVVDQPRLQMLPDGRDAPSDTDITVARCRLRLLQRGVNPVGDEPELSAARHRHRRPGMVGEHKHRHMV